eukprot:scaffold42538_cov49-Phaeocystis_antarctica.AAC.2
MAWALKGTLTLLEGGETVELSDAACLGEAVPSNPDPDPRQVAAHAHPGLTRRPLALPHPHWPEELRDRSGATAHRPTAAVAAGQPNPNPSPNPSPSPGRSFSPDPDPNPNTILPLPSPQELFEAAVAAGDEAALSKMLSENAEVEGALEP